MAAAALAIPPPIFSPFLDEQGGKITEKGVSWEGYQRAKLISPEEVTLLKSLEKLPKSQRAVTFTSQGTTYAKLYIDLLRKLQKVDTVQAVLVAISDMLSYPDTLALFHSLPSEEGGKADDPYGPLLKCIGLGDEFSLLESLRIMALLISTDPEPLSEDVSKPLLASLSKLINASTASPSRDLAIQCLSAILNTRALRIATWEHASLISGLIKSLKANPNPQVQYWVGVCFWQMTYEAVVSDGIDKKYDIIALLAEMAKQAAKEKVTRVAVATLRNLLFIAPSANLPSMLVQKILPFVSSLANRKWSDDEIVDDIAYLKTELKDKLEGLTSWDEYASEIESQHLTWSVAHDSDDFWKENGPRVGTDGNGKVLKQLIALLGSTDALVLAVAVHDIGQYVKYGGDKARKTVTDLGGKAKVMELMSNESSDVKYQALITVQRLMSHSWSDN